MTHLGTVNTHINREPICVSESLPFPFLSPDHNHIMAYCNPCSRWFPHERARQQHYVDSRMHHYCEEHNTVGHLRYRRTSVLTHMVCSISILKLT
jgi:hypothetical protein